MLEAQNSANIVNDRNAFIMSKASYQKKYDTNTDETIKIGIVTVCKICI